MNTVIQTILNRRSCRSFTENSVAKETIETILECARSAPSGMNYQTARSTAVSNREKIQKLAAVVAKTLGRNAGYNMYDPAVLIITSNEKESRFREPDNACAMENIYLACEALGLGCVWINQLKECFDAPEVRAVLNEFGIPATHGVYGCAAVGYRAETPQKIVRKGICTIIE